jgi:superfamily II DNA or RNA helicase
MIKTYQQFLDDKTIVDHPSGFVPESLNKNLFDFQRDIVRWGLRRGRAAFFEDCGLGKTPQQLAWADEVLRKINQPVLILAPNEVKKQTIREGVKFGIEVRLAASQSDITRRAIYITNYEKLHRFDASLFGAAVLDESSILKSFDGATRNLIITSFIRMPYKLACTATPAPNDFMELGNHAEFLGVMSRTEMLSTFFVHDGGDTAKWRLKGHAQDVFWKWMSSWAVNIRRPSDLNYDDHGFELPKLNMFEHVVESNQKMDGYLFALPASSLQERRTARKESRSERIQKAVELATDDQWVYWCNLNSESEIIAKELDAVELRGSTSEEEREEIAQGFISGQIKRVVTKPSLWGYGLNLQCCQNTALVGLSDSYEEFYQLIRRFWRFGQMKEVNAHVIISSLEGAVLANIHRKDSDARKMASEMVRHMADISSVEIKGLSKETITYNPQQKLILPKFL